MKPWKITFYIAARCFGNIFCPLCATAIVDVVLFKIFIVIRKQNIPEFVVCSTFAKQHDSVQKLLKGDSAVAIFVDNVEHLMDKNIAIFHSKSAGKFFLGQSCSHNHNDIAGDFLKFPFFSYKKINKNYKKLVKMNSLLHSCCFRLLF